MMQTVYFGFVLALVAVCRCEPPSSYGTPLAPPINSYGAPAGNGGGHGGHDDHGEPKAYEFGYQVKDDYSGNNYNRHESSDGNQVKGEYRVALPDGRTQIVTYWADWQSGFHADVKYEGEAQYPEATPNTGYGAPAAGNGGYTNGGYEASATSAVNIKDYSGAATPYNTNNNYNNGYDNGYNNNNNGYNNNYNNNYNQGNNYNDYNNGYNNNNNGYNNNNNGYSGHGYAKRHAKRQVTEKKH